MLQYVSHSQLALLTVTIALKTILLGTIIIRQFYRKHPVFSLACFVLCGKSWLLFWALLNASAWQYYDLYWLVTPVQDVAILCASMELIWDVLMPGKMLSRRVMVPFCYCSLIVMMSLCALNQGSFVPQPFLNARIALDRCCAFISLGIMGVVLLWSRLFSIHWTGHARTIGAGLTVYLLTSVVLIPASQYFLTLGRSVSILVSLTGETAVLLYWVGGVWVIQKVKRVGGTDTELLRLLEDRQGSFQMEAETVTHGAPR